MGSCIKVQVPIQEFFSTTFETFAAARMENLSSFVFGEVIRRRGKKQQNINSVFKGPFEPRLRILASISSPKGRHCMFQQSIVSEEVGHDVDNAGKDSVEVLLMEGKGGFVHGAHKPSHLKLGHSHCPGGWEGVVQRPFHLPGHSHSVLIERRCVQTA